MLRASDRLIRLVITVLVLVCWSTIASAQTATVTRNVNLRSDPSTSQPPLQLLTPNEPLTLLSPTPDNGYYHVRAADGHEGYVWARNVRVTATAAPPPAAGGGRGSATFVGCGDGLWKHVYKPQRLIIKQDCLTVTGTIVDATATQSHHQPDGVRHEGDGDTHGWLKVDPQFANLLNAGNASDEGGNLVFELVCHYTVTQADAKPACASFKDHTKIPPVGTHVVITGTFVQDTNHSKWNEIHPVSSIKVQ